MSGSQSGDARLREAVAAWVAGADDPSGGPGEPDTAGAADASGTPGSSGESGASGEDGTPDASETRVMPGTPADTPEAGDEDGETGKDGAEPGTLTAGEGAQGAADAASAPGASKSAPEGSEAHTDASGGADGPAEAGADAASGDAPEGDAAKAEPKAGLKTEPKAGADSGADEAGLPDAKPDAKPEPKAEPKEDVADAKVAHKGEPKAEEKSGKKDAPEAGEKDAPEADGKSEKKNAPKDDPKADDEPVDQPTGIFRVPSRPVVDQPTTTLKRSTFVPLRPDDVPGERRKPKPAPVPSPARPPAEVPAATGTVGAAQPPIVEPTRQVPLPPKPPLDLLAELTNRPTPAETPTRTVVRRLKIWTPLVALLVIIFAAVQAFRPLPDPSLTLTAAPSYSFGGSKVSLPWPNEGQGQISVAGLGAVDSFGAEKPVPIASMAKSMTAYLIMQAHPMKPGAKGASIPVDATAEKEGHYDKSDNESTLNTIKKGDVLSEKDALSAIMIPSANNVARLLARWDAGSEAAFVKKMNDTAKKLGMTQTKYTDPSGLTASTVSTAADQVKLGQELVKMTALMDITKLPSWTDPSGKTWNNFNRLVPYNNTLGIKTGSTTNAGASLLFAAKQQVGGTTQYIVGAILSQHKTPIIDTVNAVSKTALLATQSALTSRNVVKKGQVVGYVDDGLGGQTPVVATKDFEAAGWAGLKVDIKIGSGSSTIPHTAKAGTVVGQLTVGSGPGKVTAPVALQKDLPEPGFGAKLTRVG
ncbi:D-alanyl-D-alanine carboxypeptidase [Streptomyces sp. NPDC088348]|uniref:D-alanyl-D-alanine carboxypeptidase n=1 Tax=Streptomyces sp. NPDC088348 TaxID=3365853 RepID=UPI00380DF901